MSKVRDIIKILARTIEANVGGDKRVRFQGEISNLVDSAEANKVITSLGFAGYELTQDSLAVTGLSAGQLTLVESAYDGTRLFLSNGTGWYNVSLVNINPTFDSDINSAFTIVDSATPLVISNPATDSDNIVTYSGTFSDSGQYMVTLSRDSSVWTFNPLSADSVHDNVTAGNIPDSNGGEFTYTFQATDGINTATKDVTITYSGLAPPTYSVSPAADNTNEGAALTINVTTTQVADGTTLYYSIETNASDFSTTNGSFSITSGAGSFTVTPTEDGTSEGPETFTVAIRTDSVSGTIVATTSAITINDTSAIPPVTWPSQSTYGGQTYGYTMGGAPGVNAARTMDRFSMSSTGNATDVGDLDTPVVGVSGAGGSGTYGYTFGGNGTSPGWVKYQYSSGASVYSVNSTTFPYAGNRYGANAMSGNRTKGYNIGGQWGNSPFNSGVKNYYDRITYSSDTWATDVGDQPGFSDRWGHMVTSSPTTQYSSGGGIYSTSSPWGEPLGNSIFSFPFASEGNFADIGYDMVFAKNAGVYGSSASSTTYGFNFGGQNYTPPSNPKLYDITSFPFANNANSTDVGNIGQAAPHGITGGSSRTYGYMSGGFGPSNSNGIGYFPFASGGNAADVGDLTVARYYSAGGQY